MAQYHWDGMEYVVDDNEMTEVEDDMYFRGRALGESDSDDDDDDEYDLLENKITDTTAAEARRGKDIQGIPWDRLSISREKYRQTRLEQYKNYENIPQSGELSEKECKVTQKGGMYYDFWQNTRSVKSTILHFQLRNLVWSTSKHDVYLVAHYSIVHWSSLSSKRSEVLNVSGHVAPCEKHPGSLLEGFTQTQISTLAVRDNLLIAGGFQGELICKYLDRPGVSFCSRTTYEDNAITNAVDIYEHPSGAVHFMASNNDGGIRDFDMEKFQLTKHSCFPWPVNHTSLSPNGKLLAIVGDNPEGLLVDSQTGKTIAPLSGHLDYSFASAWHPDGCIFATGNQDKTCRIWDVRNLSKSVAVLKGNLGAIRSIRFTSDGRYMAMAEPADFVHVYDAKQGFEKEQQIDFFGEVSGVSFSPDTESLFIGVWDRTYGSLLQFNRRRNYMYPVIDLSKLSSEDSIELEKLDLACKEWGFFQLINHGVDQPLVKNVKIGVREFLSLPFEEKKKFQQTPEDMEGFGQLFVVSENQKLEWADLFFTTTLPSYARNPRIFPNIPRRLRDNLETYCLELKRVCITTIKHIEKALKVKPNEMVEIFDDIGQTMRVNYYPPCPQPENVIGLNPHSDAAALTILLQASDVEGLQIKKDGQWIPIKPLINAFVINVGDILEILTNGIYRSIEHRATVNSKKERISIASFHKPQMSKVIGPTPTLVTPERPALFKTFSVEDYYKAYFSRRLQGKSCLDLMRI